MVKAKFKGVFSTKKRLADGTVRRYWYHRATGRRLDGEPGDREFAIAYGDAERADSDRHRGLFAQLSRDWTGSVEFSKKAERTQKEYVRMITAAEKVFATLPLAALEDPRVRREFMDWREVVARASGEREADNRLSVISSMLSWARDTGRIAQNHLQGFRRLYHSDRSEMIWLPEHVHAFMAAGSIEMQRAMILALHTGMRQGDLIRLTWGNIAEGWISFRQGKTGRRVEIPITPTLQAELSKIERTAAVILTAPKGGPWTSRNFGRAWKAAAIAAGVTELHWHDLRGTSATLLSEAGCNHQVIATITGHSQKTIAVILDKYLAPTRVLAMQGMHKFENAYSTRFANQLQTGPSKPKKGTAK